MGLYLHIGLQRTGTTFLQTKVFPYIDELNLVDFERHSKNKYVFRGDILIKTMMQNIEKYDVDHVRSKVHNRMRDDKVNLISEENINCGMWMREDKRFDRINIVKKAFPDAKIIFGTREKADLLVSWYNKYVICGGVLEFDDFVDKFLNINVLDYEPYIQRLYELYGKNKVYVYHYEDLVKNSEAFVGGICRFLDVSPSKIAEGIPNVGYSLWQLRISRLINRIYKTNLNQNGFIPKEYRYFYHRKLFQDPKFPRSLRGRSVKLKGLTDRTQIPV